jgi:hypothetical protein
MQLEERAVTLQEPWKKQSPEARHSCGPYGRVLWVPYSADDFQLDSNQGQDVTC